MRCTRLPGGGIMCGPDTDVVSVMVNGKRVYFTFDRRFGPLLTTKQGEPLKVQPTSERHPFWQPFNEWLEAWLAKNPERPPPEDPSAKWDRRP